MKSTCYITFEVDVYNYVSCVHDVNVTCAKANPRNLKKLTFRIILKNFLKCPEIICLHLM